ncbi:hypothetical protein [Actinomadura litoris]|uniref:Uncharacterized protein n=1 Tax=Actinomadura litoris TaxID=2678616 RepID=A0A7K1LE57_9ACTN|nr:hypothetical protein [Actinomadura litoris]MUN42455.1 hypothetical protein [Actinomadura litoris]
MRLLSVTVLGTALVTAGLAAPAAGQASGLGRGEVSVEPGAARPGSRVEVAVPRCPHPHGADSPAFTRHVPLRGEGDRGEGVATVRRDAKPGRYTVTARCGTRTVTGRFKVSSGLAWPAILPTSNGL